MMRWLRRQWTRWLEWSLRGWHPVQVVMVTYGIIGAVLTATQVYLHSSESGLVGSVVWIGSSTVACVAAAVVLMLNGSSPRSLVIAPGLLISWLGFGRSLDLLLSHPDVIGFPRVLLTMSLWMTLTALTLLLWRYVVIPVHAERATTRRRRE